MTSGQTINWLRRSLARWEVFLLFVLIGIFICGAQVSRYFLTPSNISIALASMTPAALVALPMTLIDRYLGRVYYRALCIAHGSMS